MPPLSGPEPAVIERPGAPLTDRVVTLPNALSGLRLLGVPLFLYLMLVAEADLLAVGVLLLSGFTDWLDGRLARAWNQVSRVGQLLDPVADRLYVVAIVVAFAARDLIPWWFAGLLPGRDLVLATTLPILRYHGYGPLPVHFLGKAATLDLFVAFPLILVAGVGGTVGAVVAPAGWAFAVWGAGLYWWSAALYLAQCGRLVAVARTGTRA
ncbi:MAG TPA: CDP-alcohol phosphatidyltransferase family protein [Cryptosporangiaceae bacterium]|nr:CDP-alcohol phosphatidyltransferase family protein [Cryptosporangiaceae bacterium]